MDVIILLIFTAIFGGWMFWVSGRGETKNPREKDRSTDG